MRILVLVLTVSCLVPSASAQSLGEAARKEEQRRTRNRANGVRVRAFGEADVRSHPGEVQGKATTPDPASPPRDPAPTSGAASDLEREQAQRQKLEQHWRARMESARARVASAERLCAMNPLVLGGG